MGETLRKKKKVSVIRTVRAETKKEGEMAGERRWLRASEF